MTGPRLLILRDWAETGATFACQVTTAGWPAVAVPMDTALAGAFPEVEEAGQAATIVAVPDVRLPEMLPALLAAWEPVGAPLVVLAQTGTRTPPEGVVTLRGLDAAGVVTVLTCLVEHDRAVGRLAVVTREMEHRVTQRTACLARQVASLSEANARLRELDALKSGFMATVTHDLRSPLTSVLGFAKLARREFIKEFMPFADVSERLAKKGTRIADNLHIIETEGARLTRLVNDFLDLSKIEAGRLAWHDRLVDPDEVVRMAVDAVSGEYEQNEAIALVVDIADALPRLWLDPDRLMQVLVNLLTNAVRHAHEGEVMLSARPLPGDRLEFRVADTGPGIPEHERDRIFDKFHQVCTGNTTTEQRGTGLGLAICKQIVDRYGGAIRAEEREPHGTAFVVELPVEGGPAPRCAPQDERPAVRSALS